MHTSRFRLFLQKAFQHWFRLNLHNLGLASNVKVRGLFVLTHLVTISFFAAHREHRGHEVLVLKYFLNNIFIENSVASVFSMTPL